jgi:hypothetical protein
MAKWSIKPRFRSWPRSGQMNLARPFKAGKGLADEQCVALATRDSTVANATDFSFHKFVPALKGRAKFIWPLRGPLLDSVSFKFYRQLRNRD